MTLYLLTRDSAPIGEICALLVRAKSTDEARRLAAKKASGAGGGDSWLHINQSKCCELQVEGEPVVLLTAREDTRP